MALRGPPATKKRMALRAVSPRSSKLQPGHVPGFLCPQKMCRAPIPPGPHQRQSLTCGQKNGAGCKKQTRTLRPLSEALSPRINTTTHENQPAPDLLLWSDHFPQCLPAVSGATLDWKNDPAVVWRLGSHLDDVHAVFPVGLAAGLFLLPLGDSLPQSLSPKPGARQLAAGQLAAHPHQPESGLETMGARESHLAHPWVADRVHRFALLCAVHHGPSAAGLVRTGALGAGAVSPVRLVQLWFPAGAAGLPGGDRAHFSDPLAVLSVVGSVCLFCCRLRAVGLARTQGHSDRPASPSRRPCAALD